MNNLLKQDIKSPYAAMQESRQLADAQTAIFLAKQFPRNEDYSLGRILEECKRPQIAEAATYSYSRGDSEVRGASIRLAEVIARHWGNFSSGVDEIEQKDGESVVKAYAWDYESNYRDEKIFTVKHERNTKKGSYKLTDSRDIYEMVANNATRRKRACILAVIPSYVVDDAIEACQKTLAANLGEGAKLDETKTKMLDAFRALDDRINEDILSSKIGKDYDKFSGQDVVKMRNLYNAIKDGFVKAAIAFGFEKEDLPVLDEDIELDELNHAIIGGADGE